MPRVTRYKSALKPGSQFRSRGNLSAADRRTGPRAPRSKPAAPKPSGVVSTFRKIGNPFGVIGKAKDSRGR